MNSSQPKELKIVHEGFRYAARAWGTPESVPILALHGWMDNASSFDHLAPLLPDNYIVSLDLPGHGLTDHKPPGARYHFIDYVYDVFDVADEMGWDSFSIIGHSLGAAVGSIAAGTCPERIKQLILIEGIGPITKNSTEAPMNTAKSIQQYKFWSQKSSTVFQSYQEAELARKKAGDIELTSVQTLGRRGIVQDGSGFLWRSDQRLKVSSPFYFSEEQTQAYLSQIAAKVLLIRGSRSFLPNIVPLETRCSFVRNFKEVVIKGGHHIHLDDPEPVARVIQETYHHPIDDRK